MTDISTQNSLLRRFKMTSRNYQNILIILQVNVLLIVISAVVSLDPYLNDHDFSILDTPQFDGCTSINNKFEAFEDGEEFFLDDVFQEMKEMGHNIKCASSKTQKKASENKINFEESGNILFSEKYIENKTRLFEPGLTSESDVEGAAESGPTTVSYEPAEAFDEDRPIVQFREESIADDDLNEDANHNLAVYQDDTDESQRHRKVRSLDYELPEENGGDKEDIDDIMKGPPLKGERQPRLFYSFDRGAAFNTSIALTIPLASVDLPG